MRAAAYRAGVVAGVAWLTSSGMRCFVTVVRCFMRRCREVEEAVELFTKSDFARRRRAVTWFLWAVNVFQSSGEREWRYILCFLCLSLISFKRPFDIHGRAGTFFLSQGWGGGVSARNLAVFLGDAQDFVAPGSPEGVNWAWVVLVWMVVEICA